MFPATEPCLHRRKRKETGFHKMCCRRSDTQLWACVSQRVQWCCTVRSINEQGWGSVITPGGRTGSPKWHVDMQKRKPFLILKNPIAKKSLRIVLLSLLWFLPQMIYDVHQDCERDEGMSRFGPGTPHDREQWHRRVQTDMWGSGQGHQSRWRRRGIQEERPQAQLGNRQCPPNTLKQTFWFCLKPINQ